MKTPLDTRGSRANDGGSARLGKKQPDSTHAHRIAHAQRKLRLARGGPGCLRRLVSWHAWRLRRVAAAACGGCGVWRDRPGGLIHEYAQVA
jgi:hypothetical protein